MDESLNKEILIYEGLYTTLDALFQCTMMLLNLFYTRLKEKGKKAEKIYIAMGNKFIKIAFAMLKNQSPFKWNNPTFDYKQEVTKKLPG